MEQMTMLLRKLVSAAMLSPEKASEEFRHGVLKCFKALFQNLQQCRDTNCSCKQRRHQPQLVDTVLEKPDEFGKCEECLLDALQSEHMSAVIGHLFSLLLQISHTEASKAGVGSGVIRADSLSTLRLVIRKVGTAEALSFFLPGVVSGLGKVIRSAQVTRNSARFSTVRFYSVGAAGNSRALEEAARAIAELLVLVLADEFSLTGSDQAAENTETALAALETLQSLRDVVQTRDQSESIQTDVQASEDDMKIMRVKRDKEWLQNTAANVKTLLCDVFPALCAHPASAVRLAVAEAAGSIVVNCEKTLAPAVPTLLETLFALVCDHSSSVVVAATRYLSLITRRGTPLLRNSISEVLSRLLEGLPRGVMATDENVALLHARRLLASMYFSGPTAVFESFFQSPASISKFVTLLTQSLAPASICTGSLSRLTLGSDHAALAMERSRSNDEQLTEGFPAADKLPRTPPWFEQAGRTSLYDLLANILRISGLSSVKGSKTRMALTDILDHLRASMRECAAGTSTSYYSEDNPGLSYESGRFYRAAATSVCVLNEIIYGASGVWLQEDFHLLGEENSGQVPNNDWFSKENGVADLHLVEAAGTVIHDYLELWDLDRNGNEEGGAHLVEDSATLQQVLVEGVGILAIALGKSFEESGYLGLVIYPLLEKLASSLYPISHAASISLEEIRRQNCYGSVRMLLVANSDHVVDSLCRQLRHITVYPHAPELLAAVLQQTGAAPDLLPFLEEPMRGMLLELEIAGRHQHPHLTIPILKALKEITKAAMQGGSDLMASGFDSKQHAGDVEKLLDKFLERNRCQRSVLTVATSGVLAAAPLLASKNPQTCILALDVVEFGMTALSKLEAVYKQDKAERQALLSRERPEDEELFENEDINEANKLLPTMHQVWPYLIVGLQHSHPSVLVRCLHVVASVTHECGGDFLARRFQKDGIPLMLRLLQSGPLAPSKAEISHIVAASSRKQQQQELIVSQTSVLKVQEAVFQCIRDIASNERSSSALRMVAETLVGWVVAFACSSSSSSNLRELAMDTAVALSGVEADLVWIMVADLAYYAPRQQQPPSAPSGFPSLAHIFPPLASTKDALCLEYAGTAAAVLAPKLDQTAACLLLSRLPEHRL